MADASAQKQVFSRLAVVFHEDDCALKSTGRWRCCQW